MEEQLDLGFHGSLRIDFHLPSSLNAENPGRKDQPNAKKPEKMCSA
jgi:hypothetical protein